MTQNQENLKRGTAEFLILHLLSKEDLYGYQITQLCREKSGGKFVILEGTLYPIMYRMVDIGLVTSYDKLVGKRRVRKYYHLEESGREYLAKAVAEYDEVCRGIRMILDRE